MSIPSDTQPIPIIEDADPIDEDATVVFAPPTPVVVVSAPAHRRTWAWRLLFAVIAVMLVVSGAMFGAWAVSQTTYTQAEMDSASTQSAQQSYEDGYDEGYDDATKDADSAAEDAYQSGYATGYSEGAAAGAAQAPQTEPAAPQGAPAKQ